MKTKLTLVLIITAAITLSFSFGADRTNDESKNTNVSQQIEVVQEPIGGFVSER